MQDFCDEDVESVAVLVHRGTTSQVICRIIIINARRPSVDGSARHFTVRLGIFKLAAPMMSALESQLVE
jgi:hypothetical protein